MKDGGNDRCSICWSEDASYEALIINDNYTYYSLLCDSCRLSVKERRKPEYDETEINSDGWTT
jgi:hypothetical protein